MRRIRLVALLTALALATLGTSSLAAGSSGGGAGALRRWHGLLIRSLDPQGAESAGAIVDFGPTPPLPAPISPQPPPPGNPPPPPPGPTPAPPPAARPGPPAPATDFLLSNERTTTTWAHVVHGASVLRSPVSGTHRVAGLHSLTEDGFLEIYLVLRSHIDAQGHQWLQVRVPMRPNGSVGWVPRDALGPLHVTNQQLVVDRRRLRITLYDNGKRMWQAPVGVGKPASPTPAGHFWIRERFQILDKSSGYWPYAFGTADYSTLTDWPGGGVVGIHGPYYQANMIPGRISHGCIRLHTTDDAWLAAHIKLGTPLRIL